MKLCDFFAAKPDSRRRTLNARSLPHTSHSSESGGFLLVKRSGKDLHREVQRQFFDYAGPLFSVVVSPAASTAPVNERRRFRVLPRYRSRRRVGRCPRVC